jgi:hypothetical protein
MEKSYNGWTANRNAADFGGIVPLVVAGEAFASGVRAGDVHTVLEYVATQLHLRVEPVVAAGWHQADDWGYSYRPNTNNPTQLSCHASATAFDYNATRHPNGARNTFTTSHVAEIRKILAEVDNVVKWGGDFSGTKDEMHFEICRDAAAVTAVATRIWRGPPTPNPVPPTDGRYPTLRKGSKGVNVKALQSRLNRDYPAYSKLTVDGDFGSSTEAVVREFQRRAGLTVDGVVGLKTWQRLGF